MKDGFEEVGVIGVDAGLCWIGDPCYILHQKNTPKSIGNNWSEFCDLLPDHGIKQFNCDLGHAGLGVVVGTGWGDGVYPVFVRKDKYGRVMEVRVLFELDDETPNEERGL